MRWFFLTLLMLLTAAATPTGTADGYRFQPRTQRLPPLVITVVTVADSAALARSQGIRGPLPDGLVLKGYARWTDKHCTIYIIDPAVSYQPEWIGHELSHCLYGNFHPHQDRAEK